MGWAWKTASRAERDRARDTVDDTPDEKRYGLNERFVRKFAEGDELVARFVALGDRFDHFDGRRTRWLFWSSAFFYPALGVSLAFLGLLAFDPPHFLTWLLAYAASLSLNRGVCGFIFERARRWGREARDCVDERGDLLGEVKRRIRTCSDEEAARLWRSVYEEVSREFGEEVMVAIARREIEKWKGG